MSSQIKKRKVIQIANSTQMISLPRPWALSHNIKKGDELFIETSPDKLVVYADSINREKKEISIDVSDLDRTSLILAVRSMYRRGFDKIIVNYSNQTTPHYRTGQNPNRLSIIVAEVNMLIGCEIVESNEKQCIVKNMSQEDPAELEPTIKRIFMMLSDAAHDFVTGIKKNDTPLLESIEEKHDTITKFISYALRILNLRGLPTNFSTSVTYHLISTQDIVIDSLKYTTKKILLKHPSPFSKYFIKVIELIEKNIEIFKKLFFKFSMATVAELNKNRDEFLKMLDDLKFKDESELTLLNRLESIPLAHFNIVESVISLAHKS